MPRARSPTRRLLIVSALFGIAAAAHGQAAPPKPPPSQEKPAAPESPASPTSTDSKHAAGTMEYFQLESKLLSSKIEVGVYLPAEYATTQRRYPTLYFLHGLNGSAHKWEQRAANKQLDDLISSGKMGPLLVVCPDGRNSMYVNWLGGKEPWEDFLAKELVTAIDAKYRTLADRKARGINGDSAGGYGALNVAFHHPELFSSVSAHSAAIYPADPAQLPDGVKQWAPQWQPVYGWPVEVEHWHQFNPLFLATTLPEETLKKLAIYFDCGDKDRFGFNKSNEELHKILEKRGVPHEWHLREGGHGREYFEDNVEHSFLFHGALFDSALTPAPTQH